MTLAEYAKYRGVTPAYISQMIKKGMLEGTYLKGRNSYNIDATKADAKLEKVLSPDRMKKTRQEIQKTPKRKNNATIEEKQEVIESANIEEIDYHTARTTNERYKAALKKLEYEEKAGKLVLANDVEKKGFEAARQIRDQCLAIPDRCCALVAAESDSFACKQILLNEINYILEQISDGFKEN